MKQKKKGRIKIYKNMIIYLGNHQYIKEDRA